MPWVWFEPRIPAFEREKTFHALDGAATVIGKWSNYRFDVFITLRKKRCTHTLQCKLLLNFYWCIDPLFNEIYQYNKRKTCFEVIYKLTILIFLPFVSPSPPDIWASKRYDMFRQHLVMFLRRALMPTGGMSGDVSKARRNPKYIAILISPIIK
jgi:hypothetical protein